MTNNPKGWYERVGGRRRARSRDGGSRVPRVLIIVQNLPVPLDRRVWLESKALIAAGYGVSVICPSGGERGGSRVLDGVYIHTYRPPRDRQSAVGLAYELVYCWLRTAILALQILRTDGFDVVQACNPPDSYFLLGLLLKATGRPFVFDHHDLCPELYDSKFEHERPALRRLLLAMERATFRTADHVISTNESFKEVALTRGGLSPQSVTVVRSGPNLDRLQPRVRRPELREGKDFLCCYLGIMGPQDGVDLLLAAANVVVNEMGRTDCHFALLGFGPCLADLQRQAEALGLGPWTTFTGRADDDMICDYLSTADLGVSPDPKNPFNDRCTMNKTLEYMAFALPVVSFDLTETRRSAEGASLYVEQLDGDDGVVPLAKAIVGLLDDPERRAAMGEVGRRRVEQALSWQRQASRYVGVYDRLLGGAGTRRPPGEQRSRRLRARTW